jgi:hypothetical protein
MEPDPRRYCVSTTTAGHPCPARPIRGHNECFRHDTRPGAIERRQAAEIKGGQIRKQQMERLHGKTVDDRVKIEAMVLETPEQAKAILGYVIRQVLLGKLESRGANAVIQAVSTFATLHRDYQLTQDVEDALAAITELRKKRAEREAVEADEITEN